MAERVVLHDGDTTSELSASVVASTATPTKSGLVVLNADGSPVSGGGGGGASPSYITQFYTDTSYTYICKAPPGTALSSASWQVFRLDSTNNKRYAGGSAGFTSSATDLATVQGYSYS